MDSKGYIVTLKLISGCEANFQERKRYISFHYPMFVRVHVTVVDVDLGEKAHVPAVIAIGNPSSGMSKIFSEYQEFNP